ncbi:MAG: NUDIX domain-containing protein [Ilumatobacteraceae bacterium]
MDGTPRRVEIERTDRVLDDFFKVDAAYLRHERFDGTMTDTMRRLNFERGDAAAAVIVDRDSGDLLLVEQFRYPAYDKGPGWVVEAVAGMVDDDEDPADAMRREIHEEIGYDVPHLDPIGEFYLSPGGSSERIFLFHAEVGEADRIAAGGGLDEEHEDIRLVRVPGDELDAWIADRRLVDAKTLIGVLWLQVRRSGTG